jgi:CRISPR-associated endonuclease Csn1
MVESRLQENGSEVKKAIESLKKYPIYIDKINEITLENANCYKERTVLKYNIQNIKTKDVPFIVDEKIKTIIKDRLEKYNGKEREAFKDILWFNEEKQIPILSVRVFTDLTAVEVVKKDLNGKPIGYAKTGNNHHIAIYKDSKGNESQHLCTFWHAVERRKYKIPIIIEKTNELWNELLDKKLPQSFLDKLPSDNLELQLSLQENEMYVLGLSKEEFEIALIQNNKVFLSKYLYLVWSISYNKFWFRHHLETKNSDLKKIFGARETKRFIEVSSIDGFKKLNPIKVRINNLGEITKIEN